MLPITIPAKAISTTYTVEVAIAMPAVTSEVVIESRSIGSSAIPATVTRVMTVNKLLALLIEM